MEESSSTAARLQQVLDHAQRRGEDPVEALLRSGLIATPEQLQRHAAATLEEVAQLIETMPIKALLPGNSASVMDYKRGLLQFLHKQVQSLQPEVKQQGNGKGKGKK